MGKNREGRFHPRKGRPTAEGIKKGMVTVDHIHQPEQLELEERLGVDPDREILSTTGTRHPNRNMEKGHVTTGNDRKSARQTKNQFASEISGAIPTQISSDGFTLKDFESLATFRGELCISIYLPIHVQASSSDSRLDVMKLKNALQNITFQLQEKGLDHTRVTHVMKPAYDFLRNETFNGIQTGYALFISENSFRWIALPYAPKEYWLINGSFYVSPLVQLLARRENFYILVISKKQARLFEADQLTIRHIDIPDLPNGIMDVVHIENKDDNEQFRGGTGDASSHHDVVSGSPDAKDNIAMYLREVDNTLWKSGLARQHIPLVLAGVDYLVSLYKNISQYRHIWKDIIPGNHDHDDMRVLYREAKKAIQPHFDHLIHQAINEFGNQSAAGTTSFAISEIVPAAWFSRVSQLFIAKNEEIWGTFDPESNHVDVHTSRHSNDDNLIDICVSRTLLNGGHVHFIEKERMPKQKEIAAIMRF